MRAKPEYYRKQAKLSRELAKNVLDQKLKRHLLSVAEEYDRLAEETHGRE